MSTDDQYPEAGEPAADQPAPPEPVVSESVVPESVVPESVVPEPPAAEPVASAPSVAGPSVAGPVAAEPPVAEPVAGQAADPTVSVPAVSVKAVSVKAEPVAAEPVVAGAEPATGEPERTPDAAVDSASVQDADEPPAAPPRRRRLSVAGAFIGVLLGLLGFALVVQLHSNSGDAQLANERPEDLVQILSDLDSRQDRLRLEISNLQSTKQQLEAGSQSRDAALRAATQRADELGILAGTLAAQGPGIVIRIVPGNKPIASTILDMVEELRDAGAEAMQIDGGNGGSVRIIASTYFVDAANDQINADGKLLNPVYVITAIGDPQTLQPALNIAGGVIDAVHNAGGTVTVATPGNVVVAATVPATAPKYAQPVN